MSKKSKNKNTEKVHFGFNVIEDFKKFIDEHPQLGAPKYFYYLAYPIAKVELDIMENVIENFEVLEKYILTFFISSSIDFSDIENITGIPNETIKSVCKTLQVTGQIDNDFKITKLGRKSLKESKKSTNVKRRMMVLVDGVTGVILDESSIYEKFMKEGQVTAYKKVPMLIPKENFTEENFSQFYENLNFNDEDVISTNFDSINRANPIGLYYIPLYFVGFENLKSPLLLKEFNKKFAPVYIVEDDRELFREKCLCVSNKNIDLLEKVLKEISSYYNKKELKSFLKEIDGVSLENESFVRHVKAGKKISGKEYSVPDEYIGENEYSEYPVPLEYVNGYIFYFQKDYQEPENDSDTEDENNNNENGDNEIDENSDGIEDNKENSENNEIKVNDNESDEIESDENKEEN